MALPSFYNAGTATVAANGTVVTGQGTSWVGVVQPGDLFGTHKGSGIRIATVDSNTSLTLAYPWLGGAQTAAAYEIGITPDTARMQETTRVLLDLLGNYGFFQFNESGTLANRATFNAAAKGFLYLRTDVSPAQLYVKASATSGDWAGPFAYAKGDTGGQGDKGWSPIFAVAADGERRVRQLVDYVGGAGAKPAGDIGKYVGPAGYVTLIADATDERGAQGSLSGVTPFWVGRIQADTSAAQARNGLDVGILAGFRNKIINGNFDFWQRGLTQVANGYGSDDRWINSNNGSTKSHIRIATGWLPIPPVPTSASRTIVTSVAGATNFVAKQYRIEDVRTLAGKTATLTFYARADAAKPMSVEFGQGYGTGGSPSPLDLGIGVQKINLTTSWQRFDVVVNLPGLTGKTLGTDNNSFVLLTLWFDAGSSFNARSGTLGQQSGTFDITSVSLVEGDVTGESNPFAPRHYQQEQSLCQRYYKRFDFASIYYGFPDTTNAASRRYWAIPLTNSMRIAPTADTSGLTLGSDTVGSLFTSPDMVIFRTTNTIAEGTGAFINPNSYIGLDAEL